MKKRRAQRSLAANRSASRKLAPSKSLSQNQAAEQETSEHPILTLQRQLGNAAVSRLIASERAGEDKGVQIMRKPKAPVETITFGADEVPTIAGVRPDQRSSIIDTFFQQFGVKLLATAAQFDRGLASFSDTMRFPPDKKAEPDFQEVFLDQLGDIVKEGFEKVLEPVLEEELPGIGTAISLVGAMRKEVARAQGVAGQLAIRDFLTQTRSSYGDAITAQVNNFIKNSATGKEQAQTNWRSANTIEDEHTITDPLNKFLQQDIPTVAEFQKGIVSAYIRSQQGGHESEFLDIKQLGRIQVKYDDDGKFEEAAVQLASGSGSDQVANQINKLYGSPIDLRKLNTQISIAVYGDGIAGGKTYYYVILEPPDFTPYAPMGDFAMTRYNKLQGDPLTVPRVKG
jgi:hypothetical protein